MYTDNSSDQNQHLIDLKKSYIRRLRELEKKAAIRGSDTAPDIIIEIEDLRDKIESINIQLAFSSFNPKQRGISNYKPAQDIKFLLIIAFLLTLLIVSVVLFETVNKNNINNTGDNSTVINAGRDVVLQDSLKEVSVEDAIRTEAEIACTKSFDSKYLDNILKSNNSNPISISVDTENTPKTEDCSISTIYVDVVSNSPQEWIKTAPFIVIDILGITNLPYNNLSHELISECIGCGNSEHFDTFSYVLSPYQPRISGALNDHSTSSTKENHVDYFSLRPGEREAFKLFLTTFPGYSYDFRVGISYSYKNEKAIKWFDKVFTVKAHTKKRHIWKGSNLSSSIIYKGIADNLDPAYERRIKEGIDQNNSDLARFPEFKLR